MVFTSFPLSHAITSQSPRRCWCLHHLEMQVSFFSQTLSQHQRQMFVFFHLLHSARGRLTIVNELACFMVSSRPARLLNCSVWLCLYSEARGGIEGPPTCTQPRHISWWKVLLALSLWDCVPSPKVLFASIHEGKFCIGSHRSLLMPRVAAGTGRHCLPPSQLAVRTAEGCMMWAPGVDGESFTWRERSKPGKARFPLQVQHLHLWPRQLFLSRQDQAWRKKSFQCQECSQNISPLAKSSFCLQVEVILILTASLYHL